MAIKGKYIQGEAKVVYQSKDGREEKGFDALEWLAAMCSHVPGKGEQMVRYYGYYSNVSRGKRKKAQTDNQIPYILEPELSPKECKGGNMNRTALVLMKGGVLK